MTSYKIYGIESFLSKCHPFHGDIKTKSDDFEVREINTNGWVAGLTCENKLPVSEPPLKKCKTISETIVDKNVKTKSKENDVPWREISEDPEKCLKEKISEGQFSLLKTIETTKDELNLGVFNDKNDRTILHQCVRYLYPLSCTKTRKVEKGNTEIICCPDPIATELIEIMSNRESVCDLLKFVHCRLIWNNLATPLSFINSRTQSYDIQVTNHTKIKRKNIHLIVQKYFGKILESKTKAFDDVTLISVRYKQKNDKSNLKRKATCSELYQVVLHKRNLELLNVLNLLAMGLQTNLSNLKYAGIKDKKANTYQFITVNNVSRENIVSLCNSINQSDWTISQPIEIHSPLQPGDLRGNLFKIVVRNLRHEGATPYTYKHVTDVITQSIKTLQKDGFLNYYGKQRFGDGVVSSKIGLHLLNNNFIEAVKLLMLPRVTIDNQELSNKDKAKQVFTSTYNVKKTLDLMPRSETREYMVLQALNRYSFDDYGCLKGFLSIPFHLRLFYVHSYCSLVWNKVVNKRISQHGSTVLTGDLVYKNSEVYTLSESDVKSNEYSFEDVILPLTGTSVIFPDNITKTFYDEFMNEDGIDNSFFNSKKLGGSIRGSYRRILVKPIDLSWKWVESPDESKQFFNGEVILTFQLPPSCYATILIRELFYIIII